MAFMCQEIHKDIKGSCLANHTFKVWNDLNYAQMKNKSIDKNCTSKENLQGLALKNKEPGS